ncbi:alpha/beta hydrolase [Verrucomicrobiota bacterium sgz303538]
MRLHSHISLFLAFFLLAPTLFADLGNGEVKTLTNLSYKSGDALSEYEKERCQLSLYLPTNRTGFASLVWFHGGGITTGNKDDKTTVEIARTLARAGVAVATVNYRLSPKVNFPAYVEDAAAAFAWIHGHITEHGGDPQKVFMGGHSAGAYLTSMVGMDTRYLEKLGLNQSSIAGLIPVSGQMMTHFTVRKERGISENTIVADEAAPIHFTRKDTPPFLILLGDHDWLARLEENQYFVAIQKAVGNTQLTLQVIPNRNHGSIAGEIPSPGDPAAKAILAFIDRTSAEREVQKEATSPRQ